MEITAEERMPRNGSPSQDWAALFDPAPWSGNEPLRDRLSSKLRSFLLSGHVSDGLSVHDLAARFGESAAPKHSVGPEHYLNQLVADVVPHCTNMGSPRCLGHMTGAVPGFLHPLGELVMALNQNLVKQEASRAFTWLERQTIGMLHRLVFGESDVFYAEHLQRPASTLGIMAAGSTLANITALWIARNRAFGPSRAGAGVEEEGMAAAFGSHGCPGGVVLGSRLMHYSFEKAADLLGLGTSNLIKLPVDRKNRLDITALVRVIRECDAAGRRIVALVGTAGTTDCGSIDPLGEMAGIASQWGIPFHVDLAWGTPLLFSKRHRSKLAGIDLADSVTIDGHKQLHLPFGCNLLLLRNPAAAEAIEKQADYMLQEESGDLGKRSLEGSRAANALFLHAALHIVGPGGYGALIDHQLSLAGAMAEAVGRRHELELLAEPQTNLVVYRYLPPPFRASRNGAFSEQDNARINECNERLQKAQSAAGRSLVSRTILRGPAHPQHRPVVALRALLMNPVTSDTDIQAVLDEQVSIGNELWRQIQETGTHV
jgi:glutamate decarboxylase